MTQTRRQGKLVLDAHHGYRLRSLPGDEASFDLPLQLGQWVSLWVGDRWVSGPLVHSRIGEGYYVLEGPNWCPLQEGMIACCWQAEEKC